MFLINFQCASNLTILISSTWKSIGEAFRLWRGGEVKNCSSSFMTFDRLKIFEAVKVYVKVEIGWERFMGADSGWENNNSRGR
jgi:hypothetical protein